MQGDQAFQDSSNLKQGACAHPVGIFLEPVFPVGGAQVVGNRQKIENLLHLAVANHPPNAHAAHVIARHHYLQAACLNVEKIELLHGGANGSAADLLDNANAMVRVDDLIADVEVQITVHKRYPGRKRVE